MARDAGVVLSSGMTALPTKALQDGGARTLDAGALRNTAEVVNRSDAGVVQAKMGDPLTADEVRFVTEQLASSATITDNIIEVLQQVAQRRGLEIGRLRQLTADVLAIPEPEAYLAQFGGSEGDWRALPLGTQIAEIASQMEAKIATEWSGLGPVARGAFEGAAHLVGMEPTSYYRKIRALMCLAGWSDPARHWNAIVGPPEASILGVKIDNGVHPMVLDKLRAVVADSPTDLTAAPPPEQPVVVKTVLGFQPRVVQGTDHLSNHAWGLAIDVDATLNVYITDRTVMEVVAKRTKDHVDLAKDPIDPATPDEAKLAERYRVLSKASSEIAGWLNTATEKEAQLRSDVEEAEAQLREAEKTKEPARIEAAEKQVRAARDAFTKDVDVQDVGTLRKRLGEKDLAAWKQGGFFNLPLEFITEVKSKGFGWGGEYEDKKDFMHFELSPQGLLDRDAGL